MSHSLASGFRTGLLVLCIGFSTLVVSCDSSPKTGEGSNSANVPDAEKPVLHFEEPVYNFGTIKEGEEVVHDFAFTNTGKSDLLIASANAHCGCTVPDWPKKPIPPGGKGIIKATFNSTNKTGSQNKKITITANTNPVHTDVLIMGMVLADSSKTN